MSASLTIVSRDQGGEWPVAVRDLDAGEQDFPRDLDEQHKRLIQWFEEAERSGMEARALAERDRAYLCGDQWTPTELEKLKERGQPAIVINKIRNKIDLLGGMERRARTDPKAFPRTPAEDDRADAATQALRYVADDNDFQVLRSAVFENMLVEGAGGLEISLEDDGRGGANVTYTQVPWDRIWWDPHSRSPDFLDARYLGIVIWMDRDQLTEMYPDRAELIDDTFAQGDATGQYQDRPYDVAWLDTRRRRTRVVQCYWQEAGAWWGATFTRIGYLTDPWRSPFKDRRGRSGCPLILQSAYVDQDNNRYGAVRDLISLQDEINKRRSKALHLLSVAQVVAEQGAVTDVDKARSEVARPDGYVEVMPGLKFEVQRGNDLASGQWQLLQHATQEMQLAGPNAAMSGTDPRELSGRAILAQQAGGAVQNEPLADSLRMWARRVYEMTWMACREFWTAPKWVRVTDDLQATRWVGINVPVRLMDELAKMPPANRAMVMQNMQIMPGDPRLQQVIRIEGDITDLDVDITVAEGQDVPTLQAETFQSLIQLASMQPGLIPGDVLIAASSLRNKDDLLKRMQEHQQQQQQVAAAAAQKQGAKLDAATAKDQSQAAANQALAGERQVNAISKVHEMHAAFTAPPAGQSWVAPDNPPGASMQSPDPEQMAPDMAFAHQVADLQHKRAQTANTQANTALTAAKIPQTMHQTMQTAVTTNRLARTPIPQPGPSAP